MPANGQSYFSIHLAYGTSNKSISVLCKGKFFLTLRGVYETDFGRMCSILHVGFSISCHDMVIVMHKSNIILLNLVSFYTV